MAAMIAGGIASSRRSWSRAAAEAVAAPDAIAVDAALSIGITLGVIAAFPNAEGAAWVQVAGHVTIPIVIGALCLAWSLVRGAPDSRPMSRGTVAGLAVAWAVLAGVVHTGGLGLAEGSAIGLAIGAWTWMGEAGRGRPRDPRGGVAPIWVLAGVVLFGVPALWMGVPRTVAWAIAAVGVAGVMGPMIRARPASAIALVCVAPVAGLATDAVIRVLMIAGATGAATQAMGELWIVGVAEALASRPIAVLPRGFTPELCAATATLGIGMCASKLPIVVRRVLGIGLAILGAAVAVVALIS